MNALLSSVHSALRWLRKDPVLTLLVVMIVLAFVPMPFLGYRLLSSGGGQGSVMPVMPTARPTPTSAPTPSPSPQPTLTATPTATPPPTSTPLVAPLSGLAIEPQALRWPPIAVIIPSDSEQYAMSQASVVYEAAAEYRIQRFLAIFEQLDAEKIGPVRSARVYYIEWACPYGVLYVHWGGSPGAYERLSGITCLHSLDGMSGAFPFWRAEVVDIPWNNGFTSSDLLYEYMEQEGVERTADFRGYLHKDDALLENRPLTGTLDIRNAFRYPVRYVYDRETNTYLREYKGGPHLDLYTGEQHRANNVVVIFVPTGLIPGDDKGRLEIETTGEGEALFFMDGGLVEGRWVKESPSAEMRFLDRANEDVAFNRGNIWIEVLSPDQEAVYALGQVPR